MFPYKDSFKNLGFGIGLRSQHYREILEKKPAIDWFEVLTENYLDTEGAPMEFLEAIASLYPVALHGVSLSIGSPDPINRNYLSKVKSLSKRIGARWITDHLCWTGFQKNNTHDLLPVSYTQEMMSHLLPRISEVQEYLGQPILLENPSSYLSYQQDTFSEAEFIRELSLRSGCGILLDINNVYVSAHNHQYDAKGFIDAMPPEKVGQFHLAGHTVKTTHLLDTHIGPVPESVWELYKYALDTLGPRSCLIEWDEDIPDLETVVHEANYAKTLTMATSTSVHPLEHRV